MNGRLVEFEGISFPEPVAPMLKLGQRGAVMADEAIGASRNTEVSIVKYAPIAPENALFALLYVDHIEYIDYSVPGFPVARIGRDGISSVRKIGYMASGRLEDAPVAIWQGHESVEAGLWTIWHDPQTEPLPRHLGFEGLAFKLRLQNALLMPHRATSVDQVLLFKEHRRSELVALRHHIEELCSAMASNGFDQAAQTREIEKLDRALADLSRSMKGTNWRKAIGTLEVKMDWAAAIRAVGAAAIPGILGGATLGQTALVLGTTLPTAISVESTRGTQKPLASPFAYAARVSKEFGAD